MSSAIRVKKHREALRAAGLKPLQIWVPDTNRKGFAKECHRQSKMIQNDPSEQEILKIIEITTYNKDWK